MKKIFKNIFLIVFIIFNIFFPRDILRENITIYQSNKNLVSQTKLIVSYINAQDKKTLTNEVPILAYHNIAPWPNHPTELFKSLTVRVDEFNAQMLYLFNNGYTPITLKELDLIWNKRKQMPLKPIILTFDDGYSNVFRYAFPTLGKYKFKFVIFPITKYLFIDTSMYLSQEKIKEMLKSGLSEIGSHTRDHVSLKKVPNSIAYFEICQSKNDIKKFLNYDATSFCYPFGEYNGFTIETLRKCKYSMATTEKYGFASQTQNHLLLNRIRIDGRESLSSFIAKLSNHKSNNVLLFQNAGVLLYPCAD